MAELKGRADEVAHKLQSLRGRMAYLGLEVLVLTQSQNVSWLTAGATCDVVLTSDRSSISIVITQDRATILANAIEAPRLESEEHLKELHLAIDRQAWWEAEATLFAPYLEGQSKIGSDDVRLGQDMSQGLQELRTTLCPTEIERLRQAASCSVQAMRATIEALMPGMTEFEIAGLLAQHTVAQGGQVVVNLVASDDRITRFRHPLPTSKPVERYVMLVLCSRVGGVIAALTRLVHFGPVPRELEARAHTVAEVDARLMLGTREGRTLGDQFSSAERAYVEAGYPQAIREHHQGGSIGYLSREVLARPGDPTIIQLHQAFAWNPSLPGTKSEDTMILSETGPEILTVSPDWPVWDVTIDGTTLQRPAILVR